MSEGFVSVEKVEAITDDETYPNQEYRSEAISISGNHNCSTFCHKCFKAIFFDSSDFADNPKYEELWLRQLCTTCHGALEND